MQVQNRPSEFVFFQFRVQRVGANGKRAGKRFFINSLNELLGGQVAEEAPGKRQINRIGGGGVPIFRQKAVFPQNLNQPPATGGATGQLPPHQSFFATARVKRDFLVVHRLLKNMGIHVQQADGRKRVRAAFHRRPADGICADIQSKMCRVCISGSPCGRITSIIANRNLIFALHNKENLRLFPF